MDLGQDVIKFILRILPTAFRIALATGLIFPICLFIAEQSFGFIAPPVLYIICWTLTAYIFIKNSYRWVKNYFS